MAFNERGEIIRQSTETVDHHRLPPADASIDGGNWGCMLFVLFGLFLLFSSPKKCTTSSSYDSIAAYESTKEKVNPYGDGKGKIVFGKSFSEPADIQISVDGKTIGTLAKSSYMWDINCDDIDDVGNISCVLDAGYHSLYATNNLGMYSSFSFDVKEGMCKIQELKLSHTESEQIDAKNAKILNGDWYGSGYRYGFINTWNVLLSCNQSTNQYRISYPSLGCTGAWYVNSFSAKTIYFTEQIFFGEPACTGEIEVDVKILNSRKIQADYYRQGGQTPIAKVIFRKL